MKLYLALALTGLPIGAMYALQALGIVIVYKTSRVFNFATGAIGLTCAYAASSLVKHGVPALLTLPLVVLLGVFIGLLMELSVRPVKGALTRTIVTLGWLLLLQGTVGVIYSSQAATSEPARLLGAPKTLIHIGILQYGRDQVAVILIAAALAAGLAFFFRATAIGTATRAVSEAPEAARLLGIRVDRVNLVAWGIGGGISGLAGVLVTPLLNKLDTTTLVIFTVQALAAALIGRLSSLPLTFAGGIALGVIQPMVFRFAQVHFPSVRGTDELTALVVVLVALLLFRRGGRRDVVSGGLAAVPIRPLPKGRLAAAFTAGVVLMWLLPPLVMDDVGNWSVPNITQTAVWAMAVLSLVLLVGVVGQVSVCQAVFMGCGAFGTGIAMSHGAPFLLAILLGALLAAAVAAVVGLPAIRLEPLELAIATLSLAFTADRFLYSWSPFASPDANRPVPRPSWAGLDPGHVPTGERNYAWLVVGLFVVACFAVASLRRGRTGAALTALRSSEPATAAMGFSVTSVKLRGFAASGFIAGLAGALYAGLLQGASGAPFDFTRSITLLAYAVIVGVASVPGAFFGGLIVTSSTLTVGATDQVASGRSASLVTALTGLLLVGVLLVAPDGLAGLWSRLLDRFRRPAVAPPPPDRHDLGGAHVAVHPEPLDVLL
jgi:ABC-type branched-subunit amino acid transport system permease subunit